MYTIEKHVAMPKPRQGRPRKYPFADMKPGDSFFKPAEKPTSAQGVLYSCATKWAADHAKGAKFATRRMVEKGVPGVRIWRVK